MAPAPTNRIFSAIPSSQCGSSARHYRASRAPRRWANGLRSRPLIARILPTIPAIIVLKGGGHEPARTSVLGGNRSAVRGTSCPGPGVTRWKGQGNGRRSEEHTSELQSRPHLVCRLLLVKKKYSVP